MRANIWLFFVTFNLCGVHCNATGYRRHHIRLLCYTLPVYNKKGAFLRDLPRNLQQVFKIKCNGSSMNLLMIVMQGIFINFCQSGKCTVYDRSKTISKKFMV